MSLYEDENVVVKPSPIEGMGLFSKRRYTSGETVLKWNPQVLTEEKLSALPQEKLKYVNTLDDGTKVLMNIPERYVNHSDTPNTKPVEKSDVAITDIEVGDEITSSYDLFM